MFSINAGGLRVTGNLNEGVGDAAIGSAAAGQTGLPTVPGALGQLGACMYLSDAEAAGYTNTAKTIPLLYGGWYRYVQLLSTATLAPAAGQLAFWSDPTPGKKIVTTDITVANEGQVAGVILSASWTKGNYWWLYMGGGLVYIKGASTITNKTAGNWATSFQTGPASTVDAYADAGSINTALLVKSGLGVWYDTPTDGGVKRIVMNLLPFMY
jgi:hypothetical protein